MSRKLHGITEQDFKHLCQFRFVKVCRQFVHSRQEADLHLLYRIGRLIIFAEVADEEYQVTGSRIQRDVLTFGFSRLILLLAGHLHAHIVHPLLLFQVARSSLYLHTTLVTL